MPNHLSISNFSGSAPRLAPHLVKDGHASVAIDCKLDRGMLDSWREPLKVRPNPDKKKSMLQFNCCWLEDEDCVDLAFGPTNCQRIFVTGMEDYPVCVTVDEDCVPTTHRLGVPCPDTAPSATPDPLALRPDKDIEGRSYAYQYVNAYGEVGALSPGSATQPVKDGQPVVITGWVTPDPTWGITQVKIFRTVTGMKSGREQGNTPDTNWMYVKTVDIGDPMVVDSTLNEMLIDALGEDVIVPPPAGLRGITWVESMNLLVGFVGNRLHFSENNKYHNWPHYMDLDDNICAIVESNGIIYAATDGRPYAITGAADCKSAQCREAVRLPGNFPMVGCGSRRIARLASGAVYPSSKGLVFLSGKSAPVILTWGLYTEEQWQLMEPHTAVVAEYGGRVFVFMAGGAFTIMSPGSSEQGWSNSDHSSLADRNVFDAFVSRTGDFYILKEDGLYLWDRGEDLRPHTWVSKLWSLPNSVHMGSGRLVFDSGKEHIEIKVDGRVVADRDVFSSRVFRLPMWSTGTQWAVTLSGTARVSTVSIGASMHDLGV